MRKLQVHVTISEGDQILFDVNRDVFADKIQRGWYDAGTDPDNLDSTATTEITAAVIAVLP